MEQKESGNVVEDVLYHTPASKACIDKGQGENTASQPIGCAA